MLGVNHDPSSETVAARLVEELTKKHVCEQRSLLTVPFHRTTSNPSVIWNDGKGGKEDVTLVPSWAMLMQAQNTGISTPVESNFHHTQLHLRNTYVDAVNNK